MTFECVLRAIAGAGGRPRRRCGVHFFLDFRRKEPYKGDTTALSLSGAKFDVKGESIDEERNEEKGACEEKGCSEEKEVVSRLDKIEFKPDGPERSGPFFIWCVVSGSGSPSADTFRARSFACAMLLRRFPQAHPAERFDHLHGRQQVAPIDNNGLAGHIGRLIARQHQRDLGDLRRLAEMLDGLRGKLVRAALVIFPIVFA